VLARHPLAPLAKLPPDVKNNAPGARRGPVFVDAFALAEHFTRPIVISTRRLSGAVESAVATYVVLNAGGWFLTAGHVFDLWRGFELHLPEVRSYRTAEAAIRADPSLDADQRRRALRRLAGTADMGWIENCSAWWGTDGLSFRDVSVIGDLDLALGRLEPTNLLAGPYPTFKNPDIDFRPGRSLCRFGFPFEQVAVSFDPSRSVFSLDKLQLVLFPIEGILTRIIAGTGTPAQFIETSSPGLRGQSGGPVCDSRGRIWGIQSRTAHMPLGFNPTVTANGRTTEEHQFINLGWAVHVRLILDALRARGIQVDISAD
jgi:hypothetical protein